MRWTGHRRHAVRTPLHHPSPCTPTSPHHQSRVISKPAAFRGTIMTSLLQHPWVSRVTTPVRTSREAPRPAAEGPVKTVPLVVAAIIGLGLIIWVGSQHGAKFAA